MKIRWWQWLIVIYFNLSGYIVLAEDIIAPVKNDYLSGIVATTTIATLFSNINSTVSAVVIGGGLGALSRYSVSHGMSTLVKGSFHGTMAVNIIGSFLFGTVTGLVARHDGIAGTAWMDLMTTGFLGGFTTFSTFANDTVRIAHNQGILFSALYTGFSVMVAVAAILGGEFVGSTLLP